MGKISRIQLRGISRTPSDRLTEDGGCAESLNVVLDNSEIIPAFLPEDVTAKMGLPEDLQAERIFIHKTANYENYIVVQEDRIVAYTPQIEDEEPLVIHELVSGEEVLDLNSMGNTLVISTSGNMYYCLYKNRKYVFLGNKVPFPLINFQRTDIEFEEIVANVSADDHSSNGDTWFIGFQSNKNYIPEESTWNNDVSDDSGEHTGNIRKCLNALWDQIEKAREEAAKSGKLTSAIFVRYAIDLYGSTLSSMPILIPAPNAETLEAVVRATKTITNAGTNNEEGGVDWYETISTLESITLSNSLQKYNITAKLQEWNFEEWKDLITSIRIYISKPIDWGILKYSTTLSNRTTSNGISGEGTLTEVETYSSSGDVTFKSDSSFLGNFLTESSLSYLVKEIPILNEEGNGVSSSLLELMNDDGITLDIRKFIDHTSEDYVQLETQERLEDDDMKHYLMSSERIDTFNNQVILSQTSQLVNYDYNRLNSYDALTKESSGSPRYYSTSYEVTYILKGATRDIVVKAGPFNTFFSNTGTSISYEKYFSFQTFPDSRAYKMIVKATRTAYPSMAETVKYGEFEMLPHPNLDCAYYYGGIETELRDNCNLESAENYQVRAIDDLDNKLLVSEMNNPMFFPLDSRYTFQSKVLGVAVVTTALSQGQFGQFPLYVFTEDGIWAMETAADGSFISQKPLSRDVCINPDSITSIDNAVVFVTSKGVMMIQGSQVVNISPNMNGKHYTIENTAQTIIEGQDFFCDLLPAISDDTHFLAFVKEASTVYDYAGQRLIFIKKGETYQYVYKLDTQTWHKTAYDIDLVSPINSYPECLVQGAKEGKTKVYDLSTVLDAVESKTPVKGVIATRPFDLGEPDVFKAITDVRIRGQFPKGAVKFILMGSNDGITFVTLSTLRGRSWKLFRMVILADLAPTERISWVDIMYDTKFTNKLR